MLPSTLTSVALSITRTLESRGVDTHALLREVGLDPARMQDPNARYPFSAMTRLWLAATEATGDPCLGLEIGQRFHPTNLHGIGFAWLASDTLLDAFRRLVRFFRVATTAGEAALESHADHYALRLRPLAPAIQPAPAAQDATAAVLYELCRTICGSAFRPQRIELPHSRPADPCAMLFSEQLRCQVDFDAEDFVFRVDRATAEQSLPYGNAELAHANERVLIDYLADLDRHAVAAQVKARLVDTLPAGTVTEQDMAASLNLSVRSLQRKLSDEKTSYKHLLEETRRELAMSHLGNSRLTINEITYLLGFSDPSNFTRAFRRWQGELPSSYRARQIG
jgi:AraC-like DNA-binding protein